MKRGTVALIGLDPTVGHEQQGTRPCLLISDPVVVSDQKFPMVCVVPITRTAGKGALYPPLRPGPSGIREKSHALIDQLRSVDKRRVIRIYGTISSSEMQAIDQGLQLYLGL